MDFLVPVLNHLPMERPWLIGLATEIKLAVLVEARKKVKLHPKSRAFCGRGRGLCRSAQLDDKHKEPWLAFGLGFCQNCSSLSFSTARAQTRNPLALLSG